MRVLSFKNLQSSLGGKTVRAHVTDREVQSALSRFSIVAAAFGGVCNLLAWALLIYEAYCVGGVQSVRDVVHLGTAIALSPLLVLLAFRHRLPVVLIFSSMLFSILIWVWRVDYPAQCSFGAAPFRKFDEPGVLLVFLGMISIAVVLVWATIRFVVFMWRVLKSNRAGQG